MSQIFGVSWQSLLQVKQKIREDYPKLRIVVLTNDVTLNKKRFTRKSIKKTDLFIATNMIALHSNQYKLKEFSAIVLVFDTPTMLLTLPGIQLLDTDSTQDNLHIYNPKYIDYKPLYAALENKPNKKLDIKIVKKSMNVLPEIIRKNTVDGFMDKFNTFLYAATNVNNRPHVRDLLVKYIYGKISIAELNNNIKIVHLDKIRADMLNTIVQYMATEKGQSLRIALLAASAEENSKQSANNSGRRTVAYTKIANKYNVDKFDLQNLMILYRKINQIK